MSSAGHIFDMISRSKNNDALRKIRRNRFKAAKQAYLRYELQHPGYRQPDMSEKELSVLKTKIRFDIARQRRISAIAILAIMLLIISALVYVAITLS